MESAIDYIRQKGWEHKTQSGQIVLKACPYCHDEKSHFYIGQNNGAFFCHKCNEKGNLYELMKYMGDKPQPDIIQPAFSRKQHKVPDHGQADKYHQTLVKDNEALAYLNNRGINQESINRFKLGVSQKQNVKYLCIPHFQSGNLVNIKFRSLPPAEKTFRRIPDCKSVLFNSDALQGNKEIFITEGEVDAISLLQAGSENVVGASNGAGSFDPEWIDQLSKFKKIYICYDPDDAGQKGARSLAKRLGYNRCLNIELPEGQDINEFFCSGHDVFDFQELVKQAAKFDLPGVISTSTALDLLEREEASGDSSKGILTPWEPMNLFCKGFHPGDLIILSAPPKTGKTTLAQNIATFQALQGNAVLFYCLEMRAERLIKKLIQSENRREVVFQDDITEARKKFTDLPLYFAHSFKKQNLDDVLNLIREAIKRYDLKFVVFDNLHFLIRSVSNVNEELGQAVQGFKLLAEEMEIPILAIAQPRKRDSNGRDEVMRADDIKYSNSIHADCDQMILMHRKRIASIAKEINQNTLKTEALDPVTLVRIEAHRYGSGGEALLYFHGEYSRFDLCQPVNQGVNHA